MKQLLLGISLIVAGWTASDVETRVLQQVQLMMEESGGRVTFSDLHNDPRFGSEEKAFLGRLYEIFFQIPAYLQQIHSESGEIPSRREMGENFGISAVSVELLLRVMESDNRVPPLFEREPSTKEISRLNLDNIQGFIQARGDQVQITQWEGRSLPDFELETLQGGIIRKADLAGKNALLYFWFTGCPPCVRIAPILAELDQEYGSDDFRIIGFNADRVLAIDVSDELRQSYLAKSQTRYLNAHLDEKTRQAFGSVNVYPMLFFVNGDGVIVSHFLNFQEKETLEVAIQRLLSK